MLEDVIKYLKFLEFSNEMIEKMVFLIDWKYTLVNDDQLFNIEWRGDSEGLSPDLLSLIEEIEEEPIDLPKDILRYIEFMFLHIQ